MLLKGHERTVGTMVQEHKVIPITGLSKSEEVFGRWVKTVLNYENHRKISEEVRKKFWAKKPIEIGLLIEIIIFSTYYEPTPPRDTFWPANVPARVIYRKILRSFNSQFQVADVRSNYVRRKRLQTTTQKASLAPHKAVATRVQSVPRRPSQDKSSKQGTHRVQSVPLPEQKWRLFNRKSRKVGHFVSFSMVPPSRQAKKTPAGTVASLSKVSFKCPLFN